MAVTRADVLTYIENANIVEISELVKDIEEKFGIAFRINHYLKME